MKIDEIKALVSILEASSLSYLEVSEGDFHLKLGKDQGKAPVAAATSTYREEGTSERAPEATPETGTTSVNSPMVGVFYAAPSPEEEPFVRVGQSVKKGQILCIIEAMKLMNEITAERDGIIHEICVSNGDVVEYGQPLFYIR